MFCQRLFCLELFRQKISIRFALVLAIVTAVTFPSERAIAQTETVLYNVGVTSRDGCCTYGALIFDAAGNLYGTRAYYGPSGGGTVFELSPTAGGGWTEKLLHSFGNGTDGVYPYGSLIFDAAGNLYGTTEQGGLYGYGTVFELSPKSGGGWSEKVLHSFNNNGKDGASPYAGVIFDSVGNLYGTTIGGGSQHQGTAFELSPTANGWTEKILRSFSATDGYTLFAGLTFDTSGNLYGAACYGGNHGYGTVFQLTPQSGQWAGKVLHHFGSGIDGQCPVATPIMDAFGGIYGTAVQGGGTANYGVVFYIRKATSNTWQETPVHDFSLDTTGSGGITPWAGVILDAAGNLYGTTDYGGVFDVSCGGGSCGTAYELSPASGGGFTETLLHSFSFTDGSNPVSSLVLDAAGNLYGTATSGGLNGQGTVFEITP